MPGEHHSESHLRLALLQFVRGRHFKRCVSDGRFSRERQSESRVPGSHQRESRRVVIGAAPVSSLPVGEQDAVKRFRAGVFGRAAATYDQVGEPLAALLGRHLVDIAASATATACLTSPVAAERC
jgi:hypothetical protein